MSSPSKAQASSPRPRGPARCLLLASLLTVVGVLVLAGGAQAAESLGVTPPAHDVEDAIAGESYVRQVTIQNEFDSATTMTLSTSGTISDWIVTDPAGSFEIPQRTHEDVEIRVDVPEDAADGLYEGRLHLTAEPKDQPGGTGAAVRYSVAVLLSVQIGGEVTQQLSFGDEQADDIEAGSSPTASTTVTNEGNVAGIAEACARLLPEEGGEPIEQLPASAAVLPGQQITLTFDFETSLSEGEYRVEIVEDCEQEVQASLTENPSVLEVVPPGALDKQAKLSLIEHEPRVVVDRPLQLRGAFENVGAVKIEQATCTYEIRQDGELVEVLEAGPLIVPAGEQVSLTSYFTPEQPGRYEIVAMASYDGLQTEQRESFVVAEQAPTPTMPEGMLASLAPYLGAVVFLGLLAVAIWRVDRGESDADRSGPSLEELQTADVEFLDP